MNRCQVEPGTADGMLKQALPSLPLHPSMLARLAERLFRSLVFLSLALILFVGAAHAQTATTTIVSSAPNPSSYGQSVTLSAKVLPTSGGGAPTGTVTFTDTTTSTVLGAPALSPVTQVKVAAHGDHTCSLDSVGGVACWGQNYDGQLGDGTFANRVTPVAVTDLSSGVVAVANGLYHSCALTSAGGVRCWGSNVEGQLGDNTTTRRTTPVAVSGLSSGVIAISAGDLHTCALTGAGAVLCWGGNGNGRLGDNSNTRRLSPVAVSGLSSGVIAITTGANNSCAVTSSGAAMCWGKNGNGELGDNSTTDRFTPVTVYGLSSGIVGISAGGAHGCAVSSSGGVSCWGYNGQGQLGDNSTTQRLTPVAVSGLSSGGVTVSTGANHSCALTAGGVVRCWGYNAYGQLGDNSTSNRLIPVSVFGLSGATSMEAGGFHNCAVTSIGALSCWGQNVFGQLGDNSTTQRLTPVATQHPVVDAAVISLSTLDAGTHAIDASYSGDFGLSPSSGTTSHTVNQGGNVITFPALSNTSFDDPPPVPAATASSGLIVAYSTTSAACTVSQTGAISFLSAGECSITASQAGDNNYVAASDVTQSFEVLVGAASQILVITGNNQQAIIGSTFFRRLTATVLDSGNNPVSGVTVTFAAPGAGASGLFGTMTTTTAVTNAFGAATSSNFTANDTIGTYTVTATAAGVTTTASFTLTNLGRGTTTTVASAPNPSRSGQLVTLSANVLSPTGFGAPTGSVAFTNTTTSALLGSPTLTALAQTKVAAGGIHTCSIDSGGGLWCWGVNLNGLLGDGTTTQRNTPVAVSGLSSGVAAVSGGEAHSCAVTSAGAVLCWGSNSFGQIGDSTNTSRSRPTSVQSLSSGVSAVTTGFSHSCALTTAGAVWCWGNNSNGQLGDGSTTDRLTPVAVIGLPNGVAAIEAGSFHTCAVTTAGAVRCWGNNGWGQLGDNSRTTRLTPVGVSSLTSGIAAIGAGGGQTCALSDSGSVSCWGFNGTGQLGDNSTTDRLTPVVVNGLSAGVAAIAVGDEHSCALLLAGTVSCWGNNVAGQLGDNTTTTRLTPVAVVGLLDSVTAVAADGRHNCVIGTSGGVSCWGSNTFGQLGDNSTTNRLTPVATEFPVRQASLQTNALGGGVNTIQASYSGDNTFRASSGTTSHTVNQGDNVITFPALPNTSFDDPPPVPDATASSGLTVAYSTTSPACTVDSIGVIAFVSAGTCSVTASQAGDADHVAALDVTQDFDILPGAPAAIAVSAGSGQSTTVGTHFGTALAALVTDSGGNAVPGVTVTFTAPGSGASGSFAGSASTTAVTNASGVATASAFTANATLGSYSVEANVAGVTTTASFALTNTSAATATTVSSAPNPSTFGQSVSISARVTTAPGAGSPSGSITITDTTTSTVLGTPVLSDVTQTTVSTGSGHSCSIDSVGGVWCWGRNDYGQLGDNSTTNRLSPVPVSGLESGVVAVSVGAEHTCAVTDAGALLCWGNNGYGQLGNNSAVNSSTPVAVSGLSAGVVAVSAGYVHTCAVKEAGDLSCWGFNGSGRLGDNSETSSSVPVAVSGLSDVATVSAGNAHTCAVTTAGGLYCWGNNPFGQLGDNSTTQRLSPVQVLGWSSGVAAVATGDRHSCMVTTSRSAYCWGLNNVGQVGDGTQDQRLTPVAVASLPSDIVAIAAGSAHNCAVAASGAMSCWGNNSSGELGNNSRNAGLVPVAVTGLSVGVSAIDAGAYFSCAVGDPGAVSCWGWNNVGQLGDNSQSERLTPVATQHPAISAASMFTPSLGGGLHTIQATYSGDTIFDASIGTTSHTVNQAANVITFPALPNTSFDDPSPIPAATASSGLTVAYSTTTGTICSVDSAGVIAFAATGTCSVTASQAGDADHVAAADVTQSFEVLPGAPATIAVSAGSGQSTTIGTDFGTALAVLVTDSGGNAVSGVTVTFTAPSSGASGSFTGSASTTGVTDASGVATASAFTANSSAGSYAVTASVAGVATSASFTLTNNPDAPATIAVSAGSGQSTTIGTIFGTALAVLVTDSGGNPVSGVTVTFTAPSSGASGSFAGSESTTAVTNASGVATASALTANSSAGSYAVTATVTGIATPASFTLTNNPGAPATIAVSAGSGQSTTIGTDFGTALAALVTDSGGNPVSGVTVTFTAPNSGASGSFAGSASTTAVTDASGVATASVFTANTLAGTYTVSATEAGVSTPTHFTLTNSAGAPSQITASAGSGQSAIIGAAFGAPLSVTVRDVGSNPVAGVTVTFSAPGSGATGVFAGGSNVTTAVTDASGIAASSTFTANSTAGVYTVIVTATGVGMPASFSLTNTSAATTTTVSSAPNPSTFGQVVTIAAKVAVPPGLVTPTGTVTITDTATSTALGTTALGPVPQTTVAAGGYHSCSIDSGGGVACWGHNHAGQLGDGSTTDRWVPVPVTGLSSGVVSVTGGMNHSCALTGSGAVWCWGQNAVGQLGDGTTHSSLTPAPVIGLSTGVVAISSGDAHSCALTDTASVLCWGYNASGQLGDNSSTDRLTPVPVAGLTGDVAAIAAGGQHTCALSEAGAVHCWGNNSFGQLGDNSMTSRSAPVPAASLSSGVAAIAGGRYHTCAMTLAGAALCWGDNFAGQLGDNSTDSRLVPTPVSGLSNGVVSITAGEQSSCAVSGSGAVSCWGGNWGGQLGNGTTTESLTPIPVSTLSGGVSTIATGSNHSCAVTGTGAIFCWGHNNNGALGDNSISDRLSPVVAQFPATLASLQTTALTGGVRTLQASYSGDSNFAASSGTVTHTVNQGPNVITFPPLPNTARAAAPPVPQATASSGLAVTYSSSTTQVCTVSLAGQISFVTAGTCSITARQAGNANYVAATNVTRSFQVIAGTTTTLASSGGPVTFGTPVTFTATVAAPGAATPTGSVTFRNGGATIGTAALVNGVARFTTASLSVGNHAISAAYGGSAIHAASLSGIVTQMVNKAASVTTLAVSPASPLAGQSVTLTAAVAASPVQAGAPAGKVVFRDGTTVLGSANVAGGNASFSTAALAPGGHSLTASYEGSGALTGSNSQPRLLTVKLSCVNAFVGATTLTGASGTALGSTIGATGESGEPRHGGDTGPINSVWCRWTAPSSGEVVFDTLGSLYDTTLAVYSGAPVWQLTPIAGNDNISPDTKQSRVRFAATQGTAYIIAIDGAGAATGDYVLNWAAAPSAPTLLAAVLPTSRSVQLGSTATAFATMINSGGALARQCRLALPAGFPGVLTYQATTAVNALTGQPNTPVDIEPGARQSFVFAITPTTVLNTADIGLTFACQNTAPAQSVPGVNTLALSVAVQPVPDVLAIASTLTGDGIATLPLGGTAPLTAAAINIGAAGYLTASVDDGGLNLPVIVTLCRSDPATGACLAGTALVPAQRFLLANGEVATLTIQIRSTGPVAFSPGVNRLNLRLRTDDGVTRGSTGVAVRTQ